MYRPIQFLGFEDSVTSYIGRTAFGRFEGPLNLLYPLGSAQCSLEVKPSFLGGTA